jgi:hypothetical protein
MKSKTLLLFFMALLSPVGMRAQSTTQPAPPVAQQPLKTPVNIEDSQAFKRLPPDQQEWVKQTMDRLNKAVADKDLAAIDQIERDIEAHQKASLVPTPVPAPASAQKQTPPPATGAPKAAAKTGCDTSAVKKPRFSITRAMQDAITKQASAISAKTGIAVDPNAPAQVVNDAQGNPCPATPAPATKPPAKRAKKAATQ